MSEITSNFAKFELVPVERQLNKKLMLDITSTLRCMPGSFDGYCFVPKGNGKVIVGQFIKKELLDSPSFIPRPFEFIYYDYQKKGFFKFAELPGIIVDEVQS